MFETTEKNEEMMNLAGQLNNTDSKGELMLPPESVIAPAAGAIFQEPIVTAQPCRVKREPTAFLQKMKVLAQMAGEDYCYRFPVKSKDGSKKFIEGPTITLANDLAREYMNCMVDVRVVEQGPKWIYYARFVDYETGFCMTRAFAQRRSQTVMKTDAERAEDIVFQIGQSKAIRNVIVNSLQSYADFAFREAKASLVNQIGKDIENWRIKMKTGIDAKKYDLKRIEAAVGNTIDKWLAPDMARVVAELKSISDGMATFDDLYPDPKSQVSSADDLNKEYIESEKDAKKKSSKKGEKPEQSNVPLDAAGTKDWTSFKLKMKEEIEKTKDTSELAILQHNNSAELKELQSVAPTVYGEVNQLFMDAMNRFDEANKTPAN